MSQKNIINFITHKFANESPDDVLIKEIEGQESLSRIFHVKLDITTKNELIPDTVIGDSVSLEIASTVDKKYKKNIYGLINKVVKKGLISKTVKEKAWMQYTVEIVPWFWFLTQTNEFKIFQEMNVEEIITEVLEDPAFASLNISKKFSLSRRYEKKEFCVQYNESHWNFVTRLMQEAGLFYNFEHTADATIMHITDDNSQLFDEEKYPIIENRGQFSGTDRDANKAFSRRQMWTAVAGKTKVFDYEYKNDDNVQGESVSKHSLMHVMPINTSPDISQTTPGDPRRQAGTLPSDYQEREDVKYDVSKVESTCLTLEPGQKIAFESAPDKKFLITSVFYTISNQIDPLSKNVVNSVYGNIFGIVPLETPFRPTLLAEKPRVHGFHSAIVSGPKSEEIYVDDRGRVKVYFPWDHHNAKERHKNEKASCWVRVMQTSAGAGWGHVYTPRVGQEVVISFLNGDPDHPVVMGCLYNGSHTPPLKFPAEKNKTTWRSRSTQKGGQDNFNEICFDDTIGSELVYHQAEKDRHSHIKNDQKTEVLNNEDRIIGVDQTQEIGKNQTQKIGENQTELVGKNQNITVDENQQLIVKKNQNTHVQSNRMVTVDKDETKTVQGSQTNTITKDQSTTVQGSQTNAITKDQTNTINGMQNTTVMKDRKTELMGNDTTKILKDLNIEVLGNMKLAVTGSLQLQIGSSKLNISPEGVSIESAGDVKVKGKTIKLN